MFHNLFSVTALFRIINFAAFAGVVVFIFKRSILPTIIQKIQEKKLLLQNLEQQKNGIKYQQLNIDNAIEQQQYLAHELTNKINQWRMKVAQKQAFIENNEQAMRQKMYEKSLKQSQEQALINLNKSTIPHVLATVEKELLQQFTHEEAGKLFIKDIVNFIHESNA